MRNKITLKMGVVFILALIMLVPLGWVSDLIVERSHFREVAKSSISQSWTGAQSITGPLLVIPYKIRTNKQVWDDKSKQYITKQQTQSHQMIIFPDELDLDVVSDSDVRYRGLHTVPVYTTQITVKGVFTNQRIVGLGKRNPTIEWEEGYVALAIDDIRGVTTRRELDWQDGSFEFLSGSGIKGIENGMHAIIGQLDKELDRFYEFSFSFELRGMESLSFSAVGKSNSIKLKSDWPHPSFIGRLLPQKRTISDSGFEALWQASSFSTNIRQHIEKCETGQCEDMLNNNFGVALIQPVDIYQLTQRSVKYGVLFIGLTFLSFLMFEVMKQRSVHPVQYIFVGLALTLFFLLLVSLSEHLAFGLSYAIATAACTGLLTVYLTAVFQQLRYGLLFGSTIGLIYMLLFVIIRAEDAALLMGSVLIFFVLAVLMTVTRNVDWYKYDLKLQDKSASNLDSALTQTDFKNRPAS